MSSVVTRTESLFTSAAKSQSTSISNSICDISQSSAILDSVLSKQTNHGVDGSYLWNHRRFKLYSDRIEYGVDSNCVIQLKNIEEVVNHHSSKSFNQFVIKFKNKEKMIIKANTEDDKEIWIKQLNKLLNSKRYSNHQNEEIWSWKFRESEKQNNDDIDSGSNTNSTTCCFSPNINQKKRKSFIPDNVATFRFSIANEEIGKGNTSKTLNKLMNDPKLVAKYAEYGTTNEKSQEFLRMSRIIDRKIKHEESRNNKLLFLKRYYPLRQIAFGPFGHIVLANDTFKNKNIILQLADNKNMNSIIKESINILKDLKCKYCFQLIENGKNAILTYAVYSCNILMRLSSFITLLPNKRMEESLAVKFASQILDLMSCLHESHIILNQMSPEELYITKQGDIFFMDFSEFVDAPIYIGNNNYAPPEYFKNHTNDKISDLFRFGVFLFATMVGVPPFWDISEESTVTRIKNVMYEFPKFLSKTSKDIISKLLLEEREKRLGFTNIDEIARHQFFAIPAKTESLKMIIDTFSFSSTVVWPSSIVIHDESQVSKIIAENTNQAVNIGKLKMNRKQTMESLLSLNESTNSQQIDQISTELHQNLIISSINDKYDEEKSDMTNQDESTDTSEL